MQGVPPKISQKNARGTLKNARGTPQNLSKQCKGYPQKSLKKMQGVRYPQKCLKKVQGVPPKMSEKTCKGYLKNVLKKFK